MSSDIDWTLFFGVGFFLCITYFIIDKSWMNISGITVYGIIVVSFHIVRTLNQRSKQ